MSPMDAKFFDLVLWVLVPLLVLFTLWALVDCLRSSIPARQRLLHSLAILFLPVWGALYWFRSKAAQRAGESDLMARVRQRRQGPKDGP